MLLTLTLFACSESSPLDSMSIKTEAALSLEVFKTPTCGCCGLWVSHLDENGFSTSVKDMNSLASIKKRFNITPELQSCHTGVSSDGFFFEGHIPAKYITQFLAAPPENAAGLSVPGMPVGSPGMEVGERFSPYNILLVKTDGNTEVYAHVSSASEQF